MHFSWDDRVLGIKLGLGDLAPRERCMGYQCACVCSECREREENRDKRTVVRQPWEPQTA